MKILFVCQGNINRSQMAAAALKKLAPHIEVASAGTMVPAEREGKTVAEISIRGVAAMKEIGLDTSSNVVQQLTQEMITDADRVILVGPTSGGPLPELLENSSKLEKWDIPDPGYGHIGHAEARDMIVKNVEGLVERIS